MSSMNFVKEFTRRSSKVPQHISGRARRGMFAGRDKAFGNNVSFSNRRTRRSWKVNAHWKRLYSETLDEMLKFNVSTHALRCIDKAGGLDNYLLKASNYHLGQSGVAAKEKVLEVIREKENASAQQ